MEIFEYIQEGDFNSIRDYVNNNDINTIFNDKGDKPLHYACKLHNYDIIQLLLELGACPNVGHRGNRSWTPLHLVTGEKDINVNIVKLLIDYGGDIYKEAYPHSNHIWTALLFCHYYDNELGDQIREYYHSINI
jgi:ankyrin repeat protein